ncbi:hypothetical protein [Ornithinimicrobium sp. Y1694]|uniref:hypothetical protein n=1 Tax=Ornithinimicrobium sp. Y1694 TaxID=3418590 RepID=UPI003CEA4275
MPRKPPPLLQTAEDLGAHLASIDTHVDDLAWHALLAGDPMTPRQVIAYRRAL